MALFSNISPLSFIWFTFSCSSLFSNMSPLSSTCLIFSCSLIHFFFLFASCSNYCFLLSSWSIYWLLYYFLSGFPIESFPFEPIFSFAQCLCLCLVQGSFYLFGMWGVMCEVPKSVFVVWRRRLVFEDFFFKFKIKKKNHLTKLWS